MLFIQSDTGVTSTNTATEAAAAEGRPFITLFLKRWDDVGKCLITQVEVLIVRSYRTPNVKDLKTIAFLESCPLDLCEVVSDDLPSEGLPDSSDFLEQVVADDSHGSLRSTQPIARRSSRQKPSPASLSTVASMPSATPSFNNSFFQNMSVGMHGSVPNVWEAQSTQAIASRMYCQTPGSASGSTPAFVTPARQSFDNSFIEHTYRSGDEWS